MALTKSTTTRSKIVCSVVVAFLVLAVISSTLRSCHARTEPNKPPVCVRMDPCFERTTCWEMCVDMGFLVPHPRCKRSVDQLCCCLDRTRKAH
uniref:Uncharacterized protein n=1 Tax=Aegilops tauschii subsp. strangulata TaxID=200361 RepID=A0A453GKG8_AEGTS